MKDVTLSQLIELHFKKCRLPYEVVPSPFTHSLGPSSGVKKKGQVSWLGWIYETDFRTFNHSDKSAPGGVIKQLYAADPEFFNKLLKWLPECAKMWEHLETGPMKEAEHGTDQIV